MSHGDPHIGNICVDAEGQPFLVDWQLVQRGPWYIDVGYHLGPGLRLGMLHGFYLWAITLKVDPRKTAVLLERLGTAVADPHAFDEIES